MNQQQTHVQLSNGQVWMIVLSSVIAFGHFVHVHLAILFAGRDAWISLLLGAVIGEAIVYIHLKLAVTRDQTLVQHAMDVFGRWFGGLVTVIYMAFFVLVAALTIKIVSDFMGIVYPTTPPTVFLLAEFVVASWAVFAGVEVIGRTMQVLLPLMIALGILASLLSLQEKDFTQIFPIFDQGLAPVWDGSLVFITMFSELVAFTMFTETADKPEKLPRQGLIFCLIMFFLFLGPVVGPVMMFGEELAKYLAFPTYTEIQYIRISNIVERLDIIGVLLWTVGSFFRITMYMYAAVKGLAQLCNSKRENTYVIPIALLIAAMSLSIMQASREEVYHFLGSIYLVITPCIGVGLPLLTGVASLFKRKAKAKHAN